MHVLKPLKDMPAEALANIRRVFIDIDDTLTDEGRLTARAGSALARVQAARLLCVPATGRKAGWRDHIAQVAVDGVEAENGAFSFAHDATPCKVHQRFNADAVKRAERRARKRAIGERILPEVPGTARASDQNCREADIANDFCEDVPALLPSEVKCIATLMREAGLSVKISSIHVNGWFGDYDKLSTTLAFMRERKGVELEPVRRHYLFLGDSPNDSPTFGWFPNSISVANIRYRQDLVPDLPTWISRGYSGGRFAEAVELVTPAKVSR